MICIQVAFANRWQIFFCFQAFRKCGELKGLLVTAAKCRAEAQKSCRVRKWMDIVAVHYFIALGVKRYISLYVLFLFCIHERTFAIIYYFLCSAS